jgi:hypothetical protein
MIARVWRARATTSAATTYRRHFTDDVLPAVARARRVRRLDATGAHIRQRDAPHGDHALGIAEAIRRFAGADVTAAIVADDAKRALLGWDDRVEHQEITFAE